MLKDTAKLDRTREFLRDVADRYCDGYGPGTEIWRLVCDGTVYTHNHLVAAFGGWNSVLTWAGLERAPYGLSRTHMKRVYAAMRTRERDVEDEIRQALGEASLARRSGGGIPGRRVGVAVRTRHGYRIRYDAGHRAGQAVESVPAALGII